MAKRISMKASSLIPCILLMAIIGFTPSALAQSDGALHTYVDSPGIGRIAVRIAPPETPRYPEGAPIVVGISAFFTPHVGFYNNLPATDIGLILVSYLWPGNYDTLVGVSSEGEFDYGGPKCLAALRDVIRFASGLAPDVDGRYIDDLLQITPLTDNVGLYAFSHPGIAATNVLAHHGAELSNVKYFVGGENPTIDAISAVEVGYWGEGGKAVLNPYYSYPEDYSPIRLKIDYSTIGWIQNAQYPDGRPYFAVADGPDHVLDHKVPTLWGKRYYSAALAKALLDNGAFTLETWPEDLATPVETRENWPYRSTVDYYPDLAVTAPDLKVMLIFAKNDHVQPALDKPHVHQAYDGFSRAAGLWVRLNPDSVYTRLVGVGPEADPPDNPANSEPDDWMESRDWAYSGDAASSMVVSLAGVAEMSDRVRENNWDNNLDEVLVSPSEQPETMSADVDGNGVVNIADLRLVAAAFGTSGEKLQADVNDDGLVNILDLITVAVHIGETAEL